MQNSEPTILDDYESELGDMRAIVDEMPPGDRRYELQKLLKLAHEELVGASVAIVDKRRTDIGNRIGRLMGCMDVIRRNL